MKACGNCGSVRFDIQTQFHGWTTVEIDPDTDEFEVEDTEPGDGEWVENGSVVCRECGQQYTLAEWGKEEEEGEKEPTS